jgi:hypothetical protein
MTEPIFQGSLVKLRRASKFIDELESLLDDFNKDQPFSASFIFESNPPQIHLAWKGLSREVGAVLGDAIHNLRASLDLMASELARIRGVSDRNVYFPFAANAENFPKAIKDRNFTKAGADAVDLLHTFSPYCGGNELLRAIHDLDIEDKHTALLNTEKRMNIALHGSYDITNPQLNTLSLEGSTIQHFFPKGCPLEGQPVIETLRKVAREVEHVLESFRHLVMNRQAEQCAPDAPSIPSL